MLVALWDSVKEAADEDTPEAKEHQKLIAAIVLFTHQCRLDKTCQVISDDFSPGFVFVSTVSRWFNFDSSRQAIATGFQWRDAAAPFNRQWC